MRVLCLIDSLRPGGAEQSLVAMAPQLVATGIDLEVATLHDRPGLQDELTASGIRLTCLAGGGGRAGWTARTVGHVAYRRPDLIHTTLFEADIAGRVGGLVNRVPVVTSLVNPSYGPDQRDAPGLRRHKLAAAQALDVLTARSVRRFHALTTWVADTMAPRLRIDRGRIDVIPRGRDPQLLGTRTDERRTRSRRQLGLDVGTPLVLALARHEHQKGLDVLLDALPAVLADRPGTVVAIGGRSGNQTGLLERKVAELRLDGSVRFLGARRDVGDLLAAADVFVLPSRWEGLGSVLLEAMALEAPIVASDLPPVVEVLADHACLVPFGRPDLLAGAVVEVLTDPHGAAGRAAAARERFLERFTIQHVTKQMAEFYRRALERP
jgi:glycosyltransferase involved in cell wall biosynthesis